MLKWVLIFSSAENNPKIIPRSVDQPNWPKSMWCCWKKASSGVHSPWRIPSWQTPPDVALEHWMNVQFTNNLGANEGKCVPVSTPPYYFELFMKTLMDAKFVFALCQSRVSYIAPWSRGFLKLHFIVVNLPRFPKYILKHWSGKKRGTKVFNWSEVHFYRSNFLQNPYFSMFYLCKHALILAILWYISLGKWHRYKHYHETSEIFPPHCA